MFNGPKKKRWMLFLSAVVSVVLCLAVTIAPTLADPNSGNGLSLGNQEEGQILIKFTQNSGKGRCRS